jgi:hypothetical protein
MGSTSKAKTSSKPVAHTPKVGWARPHDLLLSQTPSPAYRKRQILQDLFSLTREVKWYQHLEMQTQMV